MQNKLLRGMAYGVLAEILALVAIAIIWIALDALLR